MMYCQNKTKQKLVFISQGTVLTKNKEENEIFKKMGK